MTRLLTVVLASGLAFNNAADRNEMVKVSAEKVTVTAGADSVVSLTVDVMEGYHIQANEVSSELIPTTLDVSGGEGIIIKSYGFPPAKKFRLEGTDQYLDVYDGRFAIRIFFHAQKHIPAGTRELQGRIKYQACDSARCFFPRTIEFSLVIVVE